jgi:hypothetical protein
VIQSGAHAILSRGERGLPSTPLQSGRISRSRESLHQQRAPCHHLGSQWSSREGPELILKSY